MSTAERAVSLVFITGAGRSGSTLLGTVLGGLPDVLNAGELRTLWKKMDDSDWLCGCGEPMTECEFWTRVVDASGVGVPEAAEVSRRYQATRLRIRRLRELAREDSTDPLDDDYRQIMQGLLHGLRKATGKSIIIDDSKSSPEAVVYHRFTSERVRAIHVVRDPRAVAFSRARTKLHRLRDGETRPMVQMSIRESSRYWVQMNLAADRAAKILPASTRVRYEEFCERPERVVTSLSAYLGVPMPQGLIDADGSFERRREHTVGGNPDRWTTGRERISVDDKWRRELPRTSTAAVTAMTWPLLLRYGYSLRARPRVS
jgi:hypothetical protein